VRLKYPERMTKEFFQLDPKLQLIICDINLWGIKHGEIPTWTCFIRTDQEQVELFNEGKTTDKVSVHQFGRGADLRFFTNSILNYIIDDYINEKYNYDPQRPQLKTFGIEGSQGTAPHHHIKVMETTTDIKES